MENLHTLLNFVNKHKSYFFFRQSKLELCSTTAHNVSTRSFEQLIIQEQRCDHTASKLRDSVNSYVKIISRRKSVPSHFAINTYGYFHLADLEKLLANLLLQNLLYSILKTTFLGILKSFISNSNNRRYLLYLYVDIERKV